MKTFETPVVDVKKFDVMDVLTASSTTEEEEECYAFMGANCVSANPTLEV